MNSQENLSHIALNLTLHLPTQAQDEVTYNSALVRAAQLLPFVLPTHQTTRPLSSYPQALREQYLSAWVENIPSWNILLVLIHANTNMIHIHSSEPNQAGLRVLVDRTIFFHTEDPFFCVDKIIETG
jgi:hypothetical protein